MAPKTKRAVTERLSPKPLDRSATLGDAYGVVAVPGKTNYSYARDAQGRTFEVLNLTVPNKAGWPVKVGVKDGRFQVLTIRNAWPSTTTPNLPAHGYMHEWAAGGVDPTRVYGPAIMPWGVAPIAGTLTFNLYRPVFNGSGGWVDAGTEVVTLTAPGADTLYVLVSVATDGTITLTDGNNVAAPAISDIAALPAGDKALWAVLLVAGQTDLSFTPSDSDFVDLRWS